MTQIPAERPLVGIYSGLDLVGDGLTKLTFLRAVRSAFPDHHVLYVTSGATQLETGLRPLTEGLVDEFLSGTGVMTSARELLLPLPPAFRRRFDVFIDTQSVVWRALWLRRLRCRLFLSGAAGYRLSARRPAGGGTRPVNLVRRLVVLAELASGRPATLDIGVPVPPEAAGKAARALPGGPAYVGLAPGAGNRAKCWPLDRFVETAKAAERQGGVPVFLLGPGEVEWVDTIAAAVPAARFPLQDRALWGETWDPVHTVALARRLAVAVANDSGINQMLAAADAPLVTLFGPTNAEKFRPMVRRGAVLAAQTFGEGEAMAAIPTPAVVAAMLDVWRSEAAA